MKLFTKAADGGANSGVTAYFLIEWKSVFSIALLHFEKGTREAFHEHAFNAVTLWLWGDVREWHLDRPLVPSIYQGGDIKFTPRSAFHKIEALQSTWAFSVRGPWLNKWRESRNGKLVTLTHGRVEVTGGV